MVILRSKPISHCFLWYSVLLHPVMAVTPAPGETLACDDQQVINMAIQTDIWNLEPDQVGNFWQFCILDMVLEPLVRFETARRIIPAAATHWEPNADKTVWRFHLRPEGKWSNGDPVKANDFVRTYQNYCDPAVRTKLHKFFCDNFPLKNAFKVFKGTLPIDALGVRALDDYTLEVTFERAMEEKALLTMLTHPMFAPIHLCFLDAIRRHQLPSESYRTRHHHFVPNADDQPLKDELTPEQRLTTYTDHPFISNGPFTVTDVRFGTVVKSRKNPHYWDAKNIVLQKINWKFTNLTPRDFWKVGQEENGWNMACTRNIPACPNDLKGKRFQAWAVEYVSPSTQATDLLLLNTRSEALKDLKVRRALDILLNRRAVVETILDRLPSGQKRDPTEEVSYTLVPPRSNYTPDYRPLFAAWDDDKRLLEGEALLRQAGYSTQRPLVLKLSLIDRGEMTHELFKMFRTQLFGSPLIALDLEMVSNTDQVAVLENGLFELIFVRYAFHDEVPESVFKLCKSSEKLGLYAGLCDGIYDETVDKAILFSKKYGQYASETERYAMLRSAEERLMQQHAVLPISHSKETFIVQRNIRGLFNAHHPIGYPDLRQLYAVTDSADSGLGSMPFFEIFCDMF